MKKLSLILACALLMGGISFASPVVKQAPASKTEKAQSSKTKTEKSKKAVKKHVKKSPSKKKSASAPAK